MKKLFIFSALLILSVSCATRLSAVSIFPGQGLTFNQIDYTYPGATQPNSPYGLAVVDIPLLTSTSGIPTGYLNVISGSDWVVRNMPVDISSSNPGISTMFDLGNSPGVPVTSLSILADISPAPTLSFSGATNSTFTVGHVQNNAQGRGATITSIGLLPPINIGNIANFIFNAPTELNWQTGHPNIEQDNNQCGPASVANSLAWLKTDKGLGVTQKHQAGIRDSSLVGVLDTLMKRQPGQTVLDDDFINGKVGYFDSNGLTQNMSLKHKQRPGGNFITGNTTVGGVTSVEDTNSATSLMNWIINEIKNGEDVEIAIGWSNGGGHYVCLTGAGTILGVPYVTWVEDAQQGQAGGISKDDGGYGFSFIGSTNKIVDGALTGTIDFSTSESYHPPISPSTQIKITNNTGGPTSDLHVIFTGTGGSIYTTIIAMPPSTAVPTISSNGRVTNTSTIDWGVNAIPAGQSVTIQVSSANGPIAFSSGYWTDATHQTSPGSGPINPGDLVVLGTGIPVLSFWGLIALSVLVVGAGIYFVRRTVA